MERTGWRGHAPQGHIFPCGRMIYATLTLSKGSGSDSPAMPGLEKSLTREAEYSSSERAEFQNQFVAAWTPVSPLAVPVLSPPQCLSYLPCPISRVAAALNRPAEITRQRSFEFVAAV